MTTALVGKDLSPSGYRDYGNLLSFSLLTLLQPVED
jgi:hypothetical protein